jgi:hypothetical protein
MKKEHRVYLRKKAWKDLHVRMKWLGKQYL